MNLEQYGYTNYFINQAEEYPDLEAARVIRVNRGLYEVLGESGIKNARLKGSYYNEESALLAFPTVGDFVMISRDQPGDGVIHKTLLRQSFFSRKAPQNKGEQAVAANFDHIFIVMSLNENYNLSRAERYLAQSWESGGTPHLILTKADLCGDVAAKTAAARSVAIGADVIAVSSLTGEGLEEAAAIIKPKQTVVLLGSSGAGKSTLINAIAGEELMETGAIRESDGEGRHTTTHRQMIMLKNGAMVIDTPGMRTLSLQNAEEGFAQAFDDIEKMAQSCRFSDCKHKKEPGCAIRAAIEEGILDERRLKNYFSLQRQAMYFDDRSSYQKLMQEIHAAQKKPHKSR